MRGDEDRRVSDTPPWTTGGEGVHRDEISVQAPVRLLYVDADGERRLAVQRLLEEDCPVVAFDVTTVSDADTALDWVDDRAVDCLVSASQIEGGDGLTLLESVRKSICDLPTVLVTSDGSEQLAPEAVRADVTEYISFDGRLTDVDDLPERILDAMSREQEWEDDPAYERFGLGCYLGARVLVDGELYGTVCFAGTEPKDELTLQSQQSTVRTLAKWIGYEIERHRYEQRLERQNERLDEFASMVSHDLRNPLNVAVGPTDAGFYVADDGPGIDPDDRLTPGLDQESVSNSSR